MLDPATALRSALAEAAPRLSAGSVPGQVTLAELPLTGQLSLRGNPADPGFLAGAESALGLKLPLEANRAASTAARAALWLGPDEWLVTLPFAELRNAEAKLNQTLAGRHVAVTDVSANRTILALAGPKAREVLMKGCGLDLDAGQFKPGHCAQTNLARAQVILHLADAAPLFHIYVRSSFAAYVADWLLDAMREYKAA